MKTLFRAISFLIFVFALTNINAQFVNEKNTFPEQLTLLFNNDVKMVIESREILKIPQDKKQDTLFRNLLSDINKVQDSLSKMNVPLIISYNLNDKNSRKLKVTNNPEAKAEFIFTGNSDTVASSFFNYKIEYNLDWNNRLILYANKLSGLSSLNEIVFTEIILQAKTDISGREIAAYKAKTCSYKIKNNKIDISNADIKKHGMFLITGCMDFGLSYLNDRFLSNISASINYVFSPKTETKSLFGVSGEMYVNMALNTAYKMQGNYFVDVLYNKKFPSHPFYYATDLKIFAGYLVHREGDVFPKNTWRIGADMPAGKNFRIEYVVYSNNLNNGNFGLFEIGIKYRFF